MDKPNGVRLYVKRDLFSVILMFPLQNTLITTVLFSALRNGQAVVGLEVQALGLEIGQNAQSVVLLVRTPEGPRKFLSVLREIVIGITDANDQEVIPTVLPAHPLHETLSKPPGTFLFKKTDPDRFYLAPLLRRGR